MATKSILSSRESSAESIQKNVMKFKINTKLPTLMLPKYHLDNKMTKKLEDKKSKETVKNLKAILHNSIRIQDERNHREIMKLHNKSLLVTLNYKRLKKYLLDTNAEISWWQYKSHKSQKEFKKFELNETSSQKTFSDLKSLLYTKTILYNKELKKEMEIRNEMNYILKSAEQKRQMYNSLKNKLKTKTSILQNCNEISSQCRQERDKVENILRTFREFNELEEKQRKKRINMAKTKLKVDREYYEYLRKKYTVRQNKRVQNVYGVSSTDKENVDQKQSSQNQKYSDFIKHLTYISESHDLKSIMVNIDKMNCNKYGLVLLLLYFQEQLANLETTTEVTQSVATDRVSTNRERDTGQAQELKFHLDTICKNKKNIESARELIGHLKDTQTEFFNRIYSMFAKLKINTSCNERLFMNNLPTEENILRYIREIEKKSVEMMFLVNLIENHVDTQDPETSDADSVPNLINKDYHGVEIRPHRLFNMEDPSSLPVSNYKLTASSGTLSVCPNCLEFHFENVISNIMTKNLKQNASTKRIDIFNDNVIKQFDFKDIQSKLAWLIHNQANCKVNL